MVVSEDPEFIVAIDEAMRSRGSQVVGCLEPADPSWLPDGAGIAIVDAPPSGAATLPSVSSPRSPVNAARPATILLAENCSRKGRAHGSRNLGSRHGRPS